MVNIFKGLFGRRTGESAHANAESQSPSMDRQMLEELALFAVRRGLFGITGILNFNPDDLVGRKGLEVYTEMYRRDDMVRAACNFRVLTRISSGWKIIPADPKIEPRAQEQAEYCEYMVEQMHGEFSEAMRQILTAHRYGFSVTEILAMLYKGGPFAGKVGLDRLKTRNPCEFDFDVDIHGNLKTKGRDGIDGLVQGAGTIPARRLPPWKFIIHTYLGDFGNHYGESDLRPAYRNFKSKDAIIRFWNIALERYGMPTVYAKILQEANMGEDEEDNPNGLSQATKNRIVQALKNLQAGTAAFLPAGVDVAKIEEMRGRAAYQEALQYHDRGIGRSVLLPSLVVDEGARTGSMALGKSHVDTFKMVLDYDGTTLGETLEEQLFRRFIDWNWADTQAYPGFEFLPLTQAHLEKFGERVKQAVEVGVFRPEDEEWAREGMEMPPMPKGAAKKTAPPANPAQAKAGQGNEDAGDAGPANNFHERKSAIEAPDFDANSPSGQARIRRHLYDHIVPYLSANSLPGDWPRHEGLRSYVETLENATAIQMGHVFKEDGKATSLTASKKDLQVETLPRALIPYEKRVNFMGIQKFWRDLSKDTVARLEETMATVKADTLKKTKRILTSGDSNAIDRIVLSPAGFNEFRKIMQEFYLLDFTKGAQEAGKEVQKGVGKKLDFSDAFFAFQSLTPEDALAWMKTKTPVLRRQLAVYERRAFTVTGVEKERILKEVQLTLQTGVARGHSVPDIMAQVEQIFSKYTVTGEIVDGALLTANRLETIVRTNLSEAFNTGRLGAFADPALAPYIQAYEYTAIIDPRTTEFCESYDGWTRPTTDPRWSEIWPPNHFNCRSLVVAAVTGDTWERSKTTPSAEPQEGFTMGDGART